MEKCARPDCGKTVYPIEQLKCLDKTWHKLCFKCTVCGMSLNMKNYKGYDKMPYCEAHYPKTVASVVADTPEMRRLAENTKNQSQVAYHAEYEKMKGTKTEIVDDPEIQRHKKNTQVQSQVTYTGEVEKKRVQEEARPLVQPTSPQQQHGVRAVGSIHDYDPSSAANGDWSPQANAGGITSSTTHSNGGASKPTVASALSPTRTPAAAATPQQQRAVNGSSNVSSPPPAVQPPTLSMGSRTTNGGAGASGIAVKAIYDYTAADKDEVSFLEGDVIVNCVKVDDGWMTGTVQRTLEWGMLPANYVQPHKQPTGVHRIN